MEDFKILQIGESWITERSGGMNRYYTDLINSLLEKKVNLKGFVIGSSKVNNITNGAVETFGATTDNLFFRFLKAHDYFKKNFNIENFDVIISHFALYTYPILPLIKNKPLVIQFHGPFASESKVESKKSFISNYIKGSIEKAVYNQGCGFITLSRAFKKVLIEDYKIDENKIEVIPGGVDISKFKVTLSKEECREKFNLPNDRPIMVAVRRIVKRMGLENLIDAVSEVKKTHPNVLLLIAGKGPLLEELRRKISEAGLENNVKLLGFVPDEDLPSFYKAADFSVVPTIELEGFGLIVLESLACGTPALVTPVGGLPETIENFTPELILPSSSVKALVDGINSILSGDLKLPSSEQCIDYVKTNHDWSIISKRIYEFYKKFGKI